MTNTKRRLMKKLGMICLMALLPCCLWAQKDAKAEELLDKVVVKLSNKDGLRMDYTGTENGFILMKGKKFYLNNSQFQCWYDGETLWSYVVEAQEVNISEPTPEELQSINPYYLLARYKADYTYSYQGKQDKDHEIHLSPKGLENKEVYKLFIKDNCEPQAIVVVQNGRIFSDIRITDFETDKLEDEMFVFCRTMYPKVEVIDLR